MPEDGVAGRAAVLPSGRTIDPEPRIAKLLVAPPSGGAIVVSSDRIVSINPVS